MLDKFCAGLKFRLHGADGELFFGDRVLRLVQAHAAQELLIGLPVMQGHALDMGGYDHHICTDLARQQTAADFSNNAIKLPTWFSF